MKEYVLENGLKLIYKNTTTELSSIAIALNAGAGLDGEKLGIAHVTEHMVYKGTEDRSEKQINEELSSIFGFQNAMTNYPYVVFYGSLLNEDLEKALDIFSDILLNPVFTEEGFKEEMEVIKQELNEWDSDLEQYTEDKLYLNCMEGRRTQYPIIGTKESLDNLTIDDTIDFFNQYYCANNTTMTIVSSLKFEEVVELVEDYFDHWRSEIIEDSEDEIELSPIKENTFIEEKGNSGNATVQIVFPIDKLGQWEIKALKVFNQYFGEGVNSVLFKSLRTENNLVYDVLTRVSNEEYIKVYKVIYNVKSENVEKSLQIVDELISNVNNLSKNLQKEDIDSLIKSFKLKRLFNDEQSVRLAMQLSTYDTMFGDGLLYPDEIEDLEKMPISFILDVAVKVLSKRAIQIVNN